MVVGFNHNFSYKGQVYHVQTEDSGVKNPHIITLLYRGGTILSSKKTSYADIIKVDHLEVIVEELMKSQHREMLRLLKNGDLDDRLGLTTTAPTAAVKAEISPRQQEEQTASNAPAPVLVIAERKTISPSVPLATKPGTATVTLPGTANEQSRKKSHPVPTRSPAAMSLDDIILSYMVDEEGKK